MDTGEINKGMKPYFIGIGAQKSATSWLFQCLREHPQLSLAQAKELHFFSNDDLFSRGPRWYEAQFPQEGPDKRYGEISTSYLSSPEAPKRICAYAPAVKLILLLRDPSDRAESHIRHLVGSRVLRRGVRLREALLTNPEILENGRYTKHLERYRSIFPKEQLFIGTYHEVVDRPKDVLLRIQAFLDIAPHTPKALHMKYNASAFRASTLHDQLNRMFFFLKKSALGRTVLTLLRLTGFHAARVADTVASARKGKEKSLFTLNDEERKYLRDAYDREYNDLPLEGIQF